MTARVVKPSQRVSLDVLGQWHSIASDATPDQIAIAFRGRRDVERRHLLRHNFRVYFTSLADPSSATMRAGVESARIELPETLAREILEWTKTRDGLRTIGALTVAMDVLFRILENTTDELPSHLTWEKVGPEFMAALRHLCTVKIEEIDRDHETRPPIQIMMVHVFTRARRFVQVSRIWNVTHREVFAAMIRPPGCSSKWGVCNAVVWRSRSNPRDSTRSTSSAWRSAGSADDMMTRPMGHQALHEDPISHRTRRRLVPCREPFRLAFYYGVGS